MLVLSQFPSISLGNVTVSEYDGHLQSVPSYEESQVASLLLGDNNVVVTISQETARPAHSIYTAKEAFSAHTETLWQRLVSAYYEEGLEASLKELREDDDVSFVLTRPAGIILKLFEVFHKVKSSLPLKTQDSPVHSMDSIFSGNVGSILMISWHPHTCKLAAVFVDDTVRVFGKATKDLTPVLKHRLQKNISHCEWMPYSASLLAVGCQSGILLWSLDPVSVVSRPSGSCLTHLSYPSTLPLTSFSWHPKGLSLVSVGGKGRELVFWDVAKEEACVVHSGFASCFSFLLWSPDGNRLLAAANSASMRVFECHNWTSERWSLSQPLQSAVWSQSGNILLFVTKSEPFLYSLTFTPGDNVGGPQVATQVADLSLVLIATDCGEEMRVGGAVKQLAWDPNSERLAVMFKESELIALFHSYTYPQLHLAPGGFIQGELGQIPLHMTFQKNVSGGAVLTVSWSGGKVRHIPLRYTEKEPYNASLNVTAPLNQTYLSPRGGCLDSSRLNTSLGFATSFASPLSRLYSSPS